MSDDIRSLVDRGLDFFGDAVRRVTGDEWNAATPCEGWNVRELVGHVVGVLGIARSVLDGGALAGSLAPAEVDGDPVAAWEDVAGRVRELLVGVDLSEERDTVLGRHTVAFSLSFPAMDLFLHTWDLGRALGREVRLPDDVVAWIDGFVRRLPPERLRGSRTFGPEQPAPPDADPTTRLMAFLGRRVAG